MEDKRILLCCGAGMSSGFMATSTAKAAKAMGYDHFGDLNGNGVLDPDTEYDSIVNYKVAE